MSFDHPLPSFPAYMLDHQRRPRDPDVSTEPNPVNLRDMIGKVKKTVRNEGMVEEPK